MQVSTVTLNWLQQNWVFLLRVLHEVRLTDKYALIGQSEALQRHRVSSYTSVHCMKQFLFGERRLQSRPLCSLPQFGLLDLRLLGSMNCCWVSVAAERRACSHRPLRRSHTVSAEKHWYSFHTLTVSQKIVQLCFAKLTMSNWIRPSNRDFSHIRYTTSAFKINLQQRVDFFCLLWFLFSSVPVLAVSFSSVTFYNPEML